MQNIAQDEHRCQEIFFMFYFSPPSIQAFMLFNGRLVKVPGFKCQYNPDYLFDLSQDPPVINYPSFINRWPFLKDATFDLIVTKYPDSLPRPGNPHGFANLMAGFVLPGGLTPSVENYQPQDLNPQPSPAPEEKRPPLHVVKPKPKLKQGRPRLKLYRIPQAFYNSEAFQDLKRGVIELYRILRTFSKIPKGDSLYHYNQVGLIQLSVYMKHRKEDLLATCSAKDRQGIENIRTSIRSAGRYKDTLCQRGLLYQVVRGRPESRKTKQPYVSKYLIVVSEKQRFKLIMERKKKTKPRS